jgi:hypothetical protein
MVGQQRKPNSAKTVSIIKIKSIKKIFSESLKYFSIKERKGPKNLINMGKR